jgi:hypothetical protein
VLANAQFGSRASGDQLSETLGIATTSDLNAAVQLLRGAVTWTETCTRQATTPQPIPSRAVYSIYLNEVQQFTDFVSGWKGPSYSPPRPFVPPPIPLGTVVAEKGVRFGPHFLRITYTVLRDGYIAQIIVSGPTAPRDLPLLLTRLTTAL